jgi:hypothetical protein
MSPALQQDCNRYIAGNASLIQSRVGKEKELEKENTRLKRLAADISLDNVILKKVLPKK